MSEASVIVPGSGGPIGSNVAVSGVSPWSNGIVTTSVLSAWP